MSRPAEKAREVAQALGIEEDQVPAKLRDLHQATSLRGLADFLFSKGVVISKSWIHQLISEETAQ